MPDAALFLGIEIGGTKLQMVTGNESGHIIQRLRFTVTADSDAEGICQQIESGWQQLEDRSGITAIGVGFGGPVDYQKGVICTSHQVKGWKDFSLVQWLQGLTGKPVAIENDANTAALAEALHGSGKGYETVFYATIGSGIGGGMVINGEIYHGRTPGEVEIGHLRLNKEGEILEQRCSGWAVNKQVETLLAQQPGSCLSQLVATHKGPASMLLKPALEMGDAAARELINAVADDLAFALSHVVHLFHPGVLIIGGGLSLLKEHLLSPVAAKLPQYIMQAFLPAPEIRLASLGEDVVPIGALLLARAVAENKPRI